MANRPDIIIVMTDEERAVPPYESAEVLAWRQRSLTGRRWFDEHGISFTRHYTGSLACVPSRPTIFTGQYPDLHGVTQTDGIGKRFDDSRLRWLRAGEVPTLGNWFRAAGYDTHYDGKWHISHADLEDPATGAPLATNDNEGVVDSAAVRRYLDADPLGPYGFSGWVGPEPHGAGLANSGFRRDPLVADRVVAWLTERYARRRASADEGRAIYLMTRDNVLEGDTGASLLSRQLGRIVNPPAPLRIKVPAHVAANFEGLVVRVDDTDAAGGAGHLWKLVRTFDDPATWTEPGVRHLATNGMGGDAYRTDPLDDQWELYDLTADPIEAYNRWTDPQLHELRQHLRMLLKQQRAVSVPERNQPWPYAHRLPPSGASNGLVRRVLGRFVR